MARSGFISSNWFTRKTERRTMILGVLVFLVISFLSTTAQAQFADGDGSSGDPYQIDSAEGLNEIRNDLDAHYILTADIDLSTATGDPSGDYWNSGKGWEPIGTDSYHFTGSIDGDGYTITGLFIDRPIQNFIGLFGYTDSSGEISNIQLKEVNITGSGWVGGLVGLNRMPISNSYATGSVSGSSSVGGLVGDNLEQVTNSYATASVSGLVDVGGLVGVNEFGTVTNSYTTGSVSGRSNVGALVGVVGDNDFGTITDSYWNTETSGQANGVGDGDDTGLTGLTSEQMRQQASFNGFDFTNTWQIDEGIAFPVLQNNEQVPLPGFIFEEGDGNEATPYEIGTAAQLNAIRYYLDAHYIQVANIDLTTATGDPSGTYWNDGEGWEPIGTNVNQFTGSIDGDGHTITGLFIDRPGQDDIGFLGETSNSAEVKSLGLLDVSIEGGVNRVGGLVGRNRGNIINSYTTGAVKGHGGLTGNNIGTITNSYSTVSVSDDLNVGGLVGTNGGGGSITNSYATGSVSGDFSNGGLVGTNNGSITNSYATGSVSGDLSGGLVGDNFSTVTNSYWNTETSGQGSSDGGEGLTSEEMRQQSFFTGFDFDNEWQIESGMYSSYPYLREITYDEPGIEPEVNPIPGLFTFSPDENNILFVDQNVSGGDGGGSSWVNAISELRDALAWAKENWDSDTDGTLQIWVAEGTYTPVVPGDAENVTDNEREATFQLINNVEIYGGFTGGESSLSARDWETNETVLSGDIDENDNPFAPDTDSDNDSETLSQTDHIQGGNSYHVVTGSGTDNTARLDGVTITAGYSNGSDPRIAGAGIYNDNGSPMLTNLTITGNWGGITGGGIFNINNSSPVIKNGILSNNVATFIGGGMSNLSNSSPVFTNGRVVDNEAASGGGGVANDENSNPILTNVLFDGNRAGIGGALINNGESSAILINATFNGNQAESGGAVINDADMTVVNSIFWGNTAEDEVNEFFNGEGATADITNSILNSGDSDDVVSAGTLICNSCSNLDPLFADPGNGDFTLSSNSPVINAGTNTPYDTDGDAEGVTTDLAGNDRIYNGGTVDMGAYEFQGEPDDVPQGEDKRLLVGNDQSYVFSGDDFSLVGSVETVRIISFSGSGSLKLDGEEIFAPVDIPAEDISGDLLIFTSSEGVAYGYDYSALIFELIDDVGRESEHATLDIDVAAASVDLTIESEGWRFLTSPTDGETVGNFFEPIWTQGFSGSDSPGADFANIQRLNQQEYVWEPVESDQTELIAGDAVIAYVYGDDDNNGSDDGFPKTLSSSNDNWLNLDGSYEESFFYDSEQQETEDSFYLWGNPHPIAVDLCQADLNNIAKNAYFWNPAANGGNGGYVNLSCDGGDDVEMAPFLSVWLRLTDANNSMELPAGTYLEGTTDGYFKESSKDSESLEDLSLISLRVGDQQGEFTNTTRILFHDEASTGSDLIDAPKLSPAGLAQNYLSLYSLDDENNPYALQALPTAMEEKTRIPLDIQTTESGRFTMDWTLPEAHVFSGSYFLRDNETGEVIELREGSTYTFEIEPVQTSKDSKSLEVSGKTTHPMSEIAGASVTALNTQRMNTGAAPRFELLIATSGVDGLTELGATPEDFTLAQNYPNPFNPTTQISYELPQTADVRLEVYDMLGRNVATLVDGQVAAGRHTVNFDAGNLSSGIYLYRLQAGTQIITKKLTILK